jgi:hypothetical protein
LSKAVRGSSRAASPGRKIDPNTGAIIVDWEMAMFNERKNKNEACSRYSLLLDDGGTGT